MKSDAILEAGLDKDGRLYVAPESAEFPYIYREAMEVSWDTEQQRLLGAVPRKWSLEQWFRQILAAAEAQSWQLQITPETRWVGLPRAFAERIGSFEHGRT